MLRVNINTSNTININHVTSIKHIINNKRILRGPGLEWCQVLNHRKEPVRLHSFRRSSRQFICSVRFGSEICSFRFDAVWPAFFGRVVARSDSVRFGSASGSGRFRNQTVRFGSVRFGFLFLPVNHRHRLNGHFAQWVPSLFLAISFMMFLKCEVLKGMFPRRTRYPLSWVPIKTVPKSVCPQ